MDHHWIHLWEQAVPYVVVGAFSYMAGAISVFFALTIGKYDAQERPGIKRAEQRAASGGA